MAPPPTDRPADGSPGLLDVATPVGLWLLAVAQPLFDVVVGHPPFLVAHRATPAGALAAAAVIGWLLPLPAALATAWLARTAGGRRRATVVFASLAAAAVALQLVRDASTAVAGVAAVAAATVTAAALRAPLLLRAVRLLAVVALPLPLLFVARAWPTLSTGAADTERWGRATQPRPVIVVLFDEWPLVSMLAGETEIDGGRFPNVAAFAREALWFPEATTVGGTTALATPALLTGRWPEEGRQATFDDWPRNLFTLLAPDYELRVMESSAHLCPDRLCGSERPWTPRSTTALVADMGAIALQRIAPRALARHLPTVDADWRGFWTSDTVTDGAVDDDHGGGSGRPTAGGDRQLERFEAFLDGIRAADRASLHFVHMYVPHLPWKRLPSGQRYAIAGTYPHGLTAQRWTGSRWEIDQAHQRHLLQVGAVDRLIGRLLRTLEAWPHGDDAIVVLVSDHGTSFRPGRLRRTVDEHNLEELANVPLLVRVPGRRGVDRRPATVLDVVPTVLDAIGWRGEAAVDGRSLLAPGGDDDERRVFTGHPSGRRRGREIRFGPGDLRRGPLVERTVGRFGRGDWRSLFDLATGPGLVDRPLSEFVIAAGGRASLERGADRRFDPAAPSAPVHLIGSLPDRDPDAAPAELAVALRGRIVATTFTYTDPARGVAFTALLDPADLEPGSNPIELLEVERGDEIRLYRLTTSRSRRRR